MLTLKFWGSFAHLQIASIYEAISVAKSHIWTSERRSPLKARGNDLWERVADRQMSLLSSPIREGDYIMSGVRT
jgi:hypothetical protein